VTSNAISKSLSDGSRASYKCNDASVSDSAAPNLDSALPNPTLEAFAHGYVALLLSNTDCKCVLEVNWGASYEFSDASVSDSDKAP